MPKQGFEARVIAGGQALAPSITPASKPAVYTADIPVESAEHLAFVDLTTAVADHVLASGVTDGVAHVHTRHTTTGLVVNEAEPLLLQDLRRLLERLVPDGDGYAHDDIARRGAPADEPKNAASHCRALLLPTSQCLPVRAGRLSIGRWQSLFLVELDGPRRRVVSLSVTGESA